VRGWKRLRFPRVTVAYGEPLTFPVEREPSRERQQEVADQIFARVRELYEGLATRSEERSGHRSPDRARA
jgi:1-acyl-sn-glycerol-3-phosphate acyltransferase